MPAVKQGGGYTLTFSKKNQDVKKILEEKTEDPSIRVTDYICECIRFYEKNKNNFIQNNVSEEKIKDIVEKHVMDILINSNIAINNESKMEPNLEEDLDDVDVDED